MEFEVQDMTCGGCANAITRAVTAADPAAKLDIDVAAKIVRSNRRKAPSACSRSSKPPASTRAARRITSAPCEPRAHRRPALRPRPIARQRSRISVDFSSVYFSSASATCRPLPDCL